MKIAFALIPEKGHVNPYIGPAQALLDLGHDVVVGAPGDIGEQIARAGLAFRTDLIASQPGDRVTRGKELVELIQDPERLDAWIEQLLLGSAAEQVPLLRDWYQREGVDVVVVDPLYYPAAIAAHQLARPWASVSNSLNPVLPPILDSALLRTVRRLAPRRAALFAAHGMEARFSGCDVLSPHLTVAFATEALTGPPPADVSLVGPSFPLRSRGDEDEDVVPFPPCRHLVYASFGSQIYHWPDVFAKLHRACRQLDAWLAISVGDMRIGEGWEQCDVYRYAPQLPLLQQARAFVTHGGANSVMEAIAMGVPMLVSPMCNDQYHQAWFVERAGIGRVEDLVRAPVDRIVEHLAALLGDAALVKRMGAVSETYNVSGALATARLIERLA